MLHEINDKLPVFVHGHSMGCICILTLLINNPQLNFAAVILGSPFMGFGAEKNITRFRRLIILFLATFLEELIINGPGSCQFLSHDKLRYTKEQMCHPSLQTSSSSGGIINSMVESVEDINLNAKKYKVPTLCFLAG